MGSYAQTGLRVCYLANLLHREYIRYINILFQESCLSRLICTPERISLYKSFISRILFIMSINYLDQTVSAVKYFNFKSKVLT